MSKIKTIFVCQNCGANSAKWQGKCTVCGQWDVFAEEIVGDKKAFKIKESTNSKNYSTLGNLDTIELERIKIPDNELDRIIGGGVVPGSVTLIGGEPGIGKSTLLLQTALKLTNYKSLYISGEESINQIKMRAKRLNLLNPDCYLVTETNLEIIIQFIQQIEPKLIIVDSVQTLHSGQIDSPAGSLSQIRECTSRLSEISKNEHIPVFLIGHITKDGYLAGPKLLEHMVDTVLYFEGERNYDYRILRTIKNRFGSVSDLGIYEMSDKGLIEISNPSEVLLTQRDTDLSGISTAAMLDGMRPMLIELQALVTPSYYGTPQRNSTGFDNKRLSMLLAVLEKRVGLKMISQDVFFNVAGGIKINDTATDLGAVAALVSSFFDIPVSSHYCFAGEVGLSGDIRPVRQLEKRITESEKIGFNTIFISSYNKIPKNQSQKIKIVAIESVNEMISKLFKSK